MSFVIIINVFVIINVIFIMVSQFITNKTLIFIEDINLKGAINEAKKNFCKRKRSTMYNLFLYYYILVAGWTWVIAIGCQAL